jgi:cytochrome c556
MGRFIHFCLLSILVLGVAALASPMSRGDDDEKEEKENIAKAKKLAAPLKNLVDAVQTGKDNKAIAKTAEELDKEAGKLGDNDGLKYMMWAAYKLREKGGMGVGDKSDTIKPDGIEAKIISLAKKELPAAQLTKEADDLLRMAQVAKAIAEIVDLHTPKTIPGNAKRTPAAWNEFNQRQKAGANDLIDAVKANKPDKVLDATRNLYSSCTNCHTTFRGE